jgi:hypothetical protein
MGKRPSAAVSRLRLSCSSVWACSRMASSLPCTRSGSPRRCSSIRAEYDLRSSRRLWPSRRAAARPPPRPCARPARPGRPAAPPGSQALRPAGAGRPRACGRSRPACSPTPRSRAPGCAGRRSPPAAPARPASAASPGCGAARGRAGVPPAPASRRASSCGVRRLRAPLGGSGSTRSSGSACRPGGQCLESCGFGFSAVSRASIVR